MSGIEKRKAELRSAPKTWSWSKAVRLLTAIGFEQGSGSGSVRTFFRATDGAKIALHEPHPSDEMKKYQIKDLRVFLEEKGDL